MLTSVDPDLMINQGHNLTFKASSKFAADDTFSVFTFIF